MNYYNEDAILVVKPGMIARGKEEIKKAFIAIARFAPSKRQMHPLAKQGSALYNCINY